jgi:hypothetical protein
MGKGLSHELISWQKSWLRSSPSLAGECDGPVFTDAEHAQAWLQQARNLAPEGALGVGHTAQGVSDRSTLRVWAVPRSRLNRSTQHSRPRRSAQQVRSAFMANRQRSCIISGTERLELRLLQRSGWGVRRGRERGSLGRRGSAMTTTDCRAMSVLDSKEAAISGEESNRGTHDTYQAFSRLR